MKNKKEVRYFIEDSPSKKYYEEQFKKFLKNEISHKEFRQTVDEYFKNDTKTEFKVKIKDDINYLKTKIYSIYMSIRGVFVYSIPNLFRYFSLIWNHRDWDSDYIYKMLTFQLNRLKNVIEKHGYHENSKENLKDIKRFLYLMERYKNCDNYKYGQTNPDKEKSEWIEMWDIMKKSNEWWE